MQKEEITKIKNRNEIEIDMKYLQRTPPFYFADICILSFIHLFT